MRKGWQETGVSPVGTLHNHKDVTSVRVEDFPSPDAKMMMEVMVKLLSARSTKSARRQSQSLQDVARVSWRRSASKAGN